MRRWRGPRSKSWPTSNGNVSPWIEFFAFDSPSTRRSPICATEYKLDELVKDAKTDIERAAVLKKWVGGVLKFGTPAPDVFND